MVRADGDSGRPDRRGSGEPEERSGMPDEDDDARWRDFLAEATAPLPSGAEAPEGIPARLCCACVGLLPVAGGSLSLTGGAKRALVTLCASDEVAARLSEIQYTLGEGPCHRATETGAPVCAVDLNSGPDTRRWPVFARHAVAAGAGSAFSFPMSQGSHVMGTVDLYNTGPSTLDGSEIRLGMRAADAVCLALVNLQKDQPPDGDRPGATWWIEAEANHEEVHRAVGMLMVRLGVDAEEAMARLRARAFLLDRTVTEVAADVTSRRDDFRAGE